jgi:hypothetical protein
MNGHMNKLGDIALNLSKSPGFPPDLRWTRTARIPMVGTGSIQFGINAITYGENRNMRILIPAALAASLVATNLFAAEISSATPAPLAPGKAAGVHDAQITDNPLLWVLGGAAVIAVIAVAASSGSSNNQSTASTQ